MYDEGDYLEQYCENCHDETDQWVTDVPTLGMCLRCGARNEIKTEEDRVGALIQRVREENAASLGRLREAAVLLF
jgi:hypothetical protein